jgi:hypothetical protein
LISLPGDLAYDLDRTGLVLSLILLGSEPQKRGLD